MFGRILDVVFGEAKPLSGSMTAVATLLALVALVAVDGLLNLFGKGVTEKRVARTRGVIGVATAIIAIFWPEKTAFFAVELIGLWAIAVGILEFLIARYGGHDRKDRTLLIIAAIASIVLGAGVMRWAFAGAVLISVVVGIAAMVRGVSLVVTSILERSHHVNREPAAA